MKLGLKKKPRLTRDQAMAAHPVRNTAVEWEDRDSGEVLIVIRPRPERVARVLRWLAPPPREKQITLDEVGSEVWRWCDGTLTVEQIIKKLARRYKLNRKEAEASTTEYLRQLGKRRLIGFAMPAVSPGRRARA